MDKKRILCFGDSLTWGFDPDTRTRFGPDTRWPRVMGEVLGDGFEIIEEGQNGRTIASDDPAEGEKNGLRYIGPCLESHAPLDYVIVMLGTNDCKRKFSYSAMDIAGEMQIFLEKIKAYSIFRCKDGLKIVLVSPPHISPAIRDSWLGDSFGYETSRRLSMELSSWYKQLSDMYGTLFFDAAQHVHVSDTDGCHMDAENQRALGRALGDFLMQFTTT